MRLIDEMEAVARARMEPGAYDYVAGGAGEERTIAENVEAWQRVWLVPRAFVDATAPDPSTTLLGRRTALPLVLAPVSSQRLAHPDGEAAAARAAAAAGCVYALSTRAQTDLAAVAEANGTGRRWFQLYLYIGWERAARVLERAVAQGYEAIVLTVDLPVGGRRERELAHEAAGWEAADPIVDHVTPGGRDGPVPVGRLVSTAGVDDVRRTVAETGLPVLVKGLLTAEDATAAVDVGASGVVVSNHGGRQLDGAVPSAVALPQIAAAVGDRADVIVDGGIRSGVDVFRALALGATAASIGRPYLWALADGGADGVARLLAALDKDLRRTMTIAGTPTVADITAARVRPSW